MTLPSAEFYFAQNGVDYTVFPAGWSENGCDVFDVIVTESDEFVDSILVSPVEDIETAWNRWLSARH